MADLFANFSSGLESPATRLTAITPNDASDLANATRGINVAVSGTVRLTTVAGDTGDIYLAAGSVFPVRARRVWATGTSASGIVGLY